VNISRPKKCSNNNTLVIFLKSFWPYLFTSRHQNEVKKYKLFENINKTSTLYLWFAGHQ
jgi:hypothetical protein